MTIRCHFPVFVARLNYFLDKLNNKHNLALIFYLVVNSFDSLLVVLRAFSEQFLEDSMGGYAIKKVVVPLLVPLVVIMLSSLSVFGADAKGKHVTEGSSLYSLRMPFIENAGQHPNNKTAVSG